MGRRPIQSTVRLEERSEMRRVSTLAILGTAPRHERTLRQVHRALVRSICHDGSIELSRVAPDDFNPYPDRRQRQLTS
jgi:hypothetical protein